MCCIVVEGNAGMRGIMTGDIEMIGIGVGGAARVERDEDLEVGKRLMKFDIKKKMFAVSHHPNCGPIFGAGADLFISDNCNKVCQTELLNGT